MNFAIDFLKDIPLQEPKSSRQRFKFKDVICTFDIETTNDAELGQAWMYSWAFYFNRKAVAFGRTWEEFLDLVEDICECLGENERLCVFIHNLSFEFMFMKGVLEFEQSDVFAVKPRKVLLARFGDKIEFRCSYLHSNMNLLKFTEKMEVSHKKMSGEEYNYYKMRYPWTELTHEEIEYQLCDVIGLAEAIEKEMKLDGDDFYTLPYTSTGYVRRDAKEVMMAMVKKAIIPYYPDEYLYTLLREEFRGGDTHANRYYSGMRLKEEMNCFDYSSEYPAAMLTRQYPTGGFVRHGNISGKEVMTLLSKNKAVLARVIMKGVRLRDERNGFPYLSLSKCRNVPLKDKDKRGLAEIMGDRFRDTVLDNGRILETSYLETTINDIDLKILLDTYDWDEIIFLEVASANYGRLPKAYCNLIKNYFSKKTELKGVQGQEYFYDKAKNKLNSLYGMMVQDPGKPPIIFNQHPVDCQSVFEYGEGSISEFLLEYRKKAFLLYQWGVWVTSWGRYMLHEARKCCEFEDVAYCDTDSIKGFMDEGCFTELNKRNRDMALDAGAWAKNKSGKIYYMGVLEQEESYREFKTWGAKKYAYRDSDGELHITIAGVGKQKGAEELEKAGGIDKFNIGFKFTEAGGSEAVYNDNVDFEIEREGHKLRITDNLLLKPSEYTLGVSKDYGTILGIWG